MSQHSNTNQNDSISFDIDMDELQTIPARRDPTMLMSDVNVVAELERIRNLPAHEGSRFPSACLHLLKNQSLENNFCIDCQATNPEWASVQFGCLLCKDCSMEHSSLKVQSNIIRHLTMDTWSHVQVLTMLEGGNAKLQRDFETYRLTKDKGPERYRTKVAQFYRATLSKQVRAKILASMDLPTQVQPLLKDCARRSRSIVDHSSQAHKPDNVEDTDRDHGGHLSSSSLTK